MQETGRTLVSEEDGEKRQSRTDEGMDEPQEGDPDSIVDGRGRLES